MVEEIKGAVKEAARVIPKNQMFDIFSFIDERHIVSLKIRQLNKRYAMLVDLDDPNLNQLRRKQVEVRVTNS